MTKKSLELLEKVLLKIKNPDGNVIKALADIRRDLAIYDSRKGQLKESYDYDW